MPLRSSPYERRLLPWVVLLVTACAGSGVKEQPVRAPSPETPHATAALPVENTARPAAVAPEASPASAEEPVLFGRGSSVVDDTGMEVVRRHAERLRADPKLVVTLVGRTDDLGSRSYNVAVADRRVIAVAAALRRLDVPRGQIRRASAGGEVARVACADDECRASRRRVDFFFSSPKRHRALSGAGRIKSSRE